MCSHRSPETGSFWANGCEALHPAAIERDLESNWAVVAEALQTILRREGYPQPYEALKALTRTHGIIDARAIAEFITGLDVAPHIKAELSAVTPQNYTGLIDY